MSTITAQLSDSILRARFRGMNGLEWEREALWVLQYATRWANSSWSTGLSPAKASPHKAPSVSFMSPCLPPRLWEYSVCRSLCALADGRRWRIRVCARGKGFEPERCIAQRRPAISIHNLVLSPSLYLLSSSLLFFPLPYLFLSLWVIRMHPGCPSPPSLITRGESRAGRWMHSWPDPALNKSIHNTRYRAARRPAAAQQHRRYSQAGGGGIYLSRNVFRI